MVDDTQNYWDFGLLPSSGKRLALSKGPN
jgi:hypothetical protein